MADDDNNELNDELTSFRKKWHEEIHSKQTTERTSAPGSSTTNEEDEAKDSSDDAEKQKEEEAARLFLQGVELERKKLVYNAIEFYKKAIRLVPDIETRIADYYAKIDISQNEDEYSDDGVLSESNFQSESSASLEWVTKKFKVLGVGGLCSPLYDTKQAHISVLPSELLIYILRWVISSELDLRSLEQVALVCKWFYACARDESVWRAACLRVWSVNCGHPTAFNGCWRQMLLERPHLNFHGVYINRNSYVRAGEQSLDGFYRPFHLIEYYRYLRFYADGTVLVSTSHDEPLTVIPTLRRKHQTTTTTTIIKGHYRLVGDTVTIATTRTEKSQSESRSRRQRGLTPSIQEQMFNMIDWPEFLQ
eukprot:gene11949-13185_t